MSPEDKFQLLFDIGKNVCAAYTGFSAHEIEFCKQKSNWCSLRNFLLSHDPYEALIHLDLNPDMNIIKYYQLFIGCMLQFPDETDNIRLKNVLHIIDDEGSLDEPVTNSKMLRALLAISSRYSKTHRDTLFMLFVNCKRILAHVFKKFPDLFKLNLLRSTGKSRKPRFSKEEIDMFW